MAQQASDNRAAEDVGSIVSASAIPYLVDDEWDGKQDHLRATEQKRLELWTFVQSVLAAGYFSMSPDCTYAAKLVLGRTDASSSANSNLSKSKG